MSEAIKEAPTNYTINLITTAEAAELLGINADTARRLCRDGRLQEAGISCVKIGEGKTGDWRVSQNDIIAKVGSRGVLTPQEAAERLSLNPRTIKRQILAGKIGGLKLGEGRGTLYRISIEALEKLLTR